MTPDDLRQRLASLRHSLADQMRNYPTPVAGCDQQFNRLLEHRQQVSAALKRFDDLAAGGALDAADLDRFRSLAEALEETGRFR